MNAGSFLALLLLAGLPLGPVDQAVSQGRFQEAADRLQKIAIDAGPARAKPAAGEEKVLRRMVAAARKRLAGKGAAVELDAARQVLCLSRSWLPEELPGTAEALRVGGAVSRPELAGKAAYPEPRPERRTQGIVIVEVVVDEEGCVRQPRVLKSVPGLDGEALTAVRAWTFRPARWNGKVVAVHYVLTVTFHVW